MISVNATLTSKNQLTLPIKLVRKFKLDKNRSLIISEKKNGTIEIRPQPSLQSRMQKHWDEFHRTHPDFPKLTDEDIRHEARLAYEDYFKCNPDKL